MVFKIPNIVCDDKEIANNFRANVNTYTRQARIKMNINTGTDHPVDLILPSISKPAMDGMTAKIHIVGKETETNKDFNVSIGFAIFKGMWSVTGTVGYQKVNESLRTIGDLFTIIKKYFI